MTRGSFPAILAAAILVFVQAGPVRASEPLSQSIVSRIESMPRLPQPLVMRDWRRTALDYVTFVTDLDRTGDRLPLARRGTPAEPWPRIPSYVGANGGTEALNYLALVASGALAGCDLRRRGGLDWVALSTNWFNPETGVCANNPRGGTGSSMWYDVFANVLFCRVAELYPDDRELGWRMRRLAERWAEACEALGGSTHPPALPDFDHTGFDVRMMQPRDHSGRIEPEGAAGIAWIEYLAWRRFGDRRSLVVAEQALGALERKPAVANPLYEVLLPYGALTAARLNAESGRRYDVAKWVDWCFTPRDRPQARPWWGVIATRFGEVDAHGLVGSATDSGGYAFAMNTFEWAGALVPLARYDPRYARAIGRWMLHVANNARLFYPDALPAGFQDDQAWSAAQDPAGGVAYEGLRRHAVRHGRATGGSSSSRDAAPPEAGSWRDTLARDGRCQVLTARAGASPAWTWEMAVPPGTAATLIVHAWCDSAETNGAFRWSVAATPDGPWMPRFEIRSDDRGRGYGCPLPAVAGRVWVRAARSGGPADATATLRVDSLVVRSTDPATSPQATGDAGFHDADALNLCLYGSSHVGLLGAIVAPTSDPAIPRLDLLATDAGHAPAWPSWLLYNPRGEAVEVKVETGAGPSDLYDAVQRGIVACGVRGATSLRLEADTAVVIVALPSGAALERAGGRVTAAGRIVAFEGAGAN